MNTPELQFIYAYPLDGNQRRQYEAEGKEYPSRPEIREIMTHWRELWSKQTKNTASSLLWLK